MKFREEQIGDCRLICGDTRSVLKSLPDESVHCIVTSPPYWGLRDYGTGRWEGGDPACEHTLTRRDHGDEKQATSAGTSRDSIAGLSACRLCGARRIDEQMGLEPTLGEHIGAMVTLFREVRRVLRKDGTVWLNYGDCYAANRGGTYQPAETLAGGLHGKMGNGEIVNRGRGTGFNPSRHPDGHQLKHKDLCMIPNRLAIALQDDGWWIRSEIIWHKPNPMPESIKDRPATAHEKIWLLTKSARYFYDHEAVRTEAKSPGQYVVPDGWATGPGSHDVVAHSRRKDKNDKQRGHGPRHAGFNARWDAKEAAGQLQAGRNLRNVWTIPTKPFSQAHFATFPPDIPERCIKAGCPKDGIVLDPFGGAGTVGLVASRLQCKSILIELNPEYCRIARERMQDEGGFFALPKPLPEPKKPEQIDMLKEVS